jgi:hypothetical protein
VGRNEPRHDEGVAQAGVCRQLVVAAFPDPALENADATADGDAVQGIKGTVIDTLLCRYEDLPALAGTDDFLRLDVLPIDLTGGCIHEKEEVWQAEGEPVVEVFGVLVAIPPPQATLMEILCPPVGRGTALDLG